MRLNSNLGYYTNYMNLLDLAAIAVPAGFPARRPALRHHLVAPAFNDVALCALGGVANARRRSRWGRPDCRCPRAKARRSRRASMVQLAVCGAHMSGLPLNYQLLERGARLSRMPHAPEYRLYALAGRPAPRPGMVRADAGGAIDVEVWELPAPAFGSFVAAIPAPLGIGTVELEDGEQVKGFLCEAQATQGARDITGLGGWRQFIQGGNP